MNPNLIERELVHSIVGAFYAVYRYFDYGLVESIYAGALAFELEDRGIASSANWPSRSHIAAGTSPGSGSIWWSTTKSSSRSSPLK